MDTLSAWLARKGIHIYKVRRATTVIMSSSEKLIREYHLR